MRTKTTIKAWLDDLRRPPDDTWVLFTNPHKLIEALEEERIYCISLDHKLAHTYKIDGYDIAKTILSIARKGGAVPSTMLCHSTNPYGSKNIRRTLRAAEYYANYFVTNR